MALKLNLNYVGKYADKEKFDSDSTFTHAITFLIFNILWEYRCFLS